MTYDAAVDTLATTTAICVVASRTGEIVRESSMITDPDAIFGVLAPYLPRLHLVGHEATTWSARLHGTPFRRGADADLAPTVPA
jgi:hypothetical protein